LKGLNFAIDKYISHENDFDRHQRVPNQTFDLVWIDDCYFDISGDMEPGSPAAHLQSKSNETFIYLLPLCFDLSEAASLAVGAASTIGASSQHPLLGNPVIHCVWDFRLDNHTAPDADVDVDADANADDSDVDAEAHLNCLTISARHSPSHGNCIAGQRGVTVRATSAISGSVASANRVPHATASVERPGGFDCRDRRRISRGRGTRDRRSAASLSPPALRSGIASEAAGVGW
jgi:hypothetical protein